MPQQPPQPVPQQPPADDGGARAQRTTVLRIAGGAVALQGVVLLVLAAIEAGVGAFGHPDDRGLALFTAAFGLLAGAALLVAARGVLRFRRAAYSPVVLAEVLAIPVGISLLQSDRWFAGVAVIVVAVVVLVLLLVTTDGRALLERGE